MPSDKVKWRDAKELRDRIEALEAQLAQAKAALDAADKIVRCAINGGSLSDAISDYAKVRMQDAE